MNPRVKSVKPIEGYKLDIIFENNEEKIYYCSCILQQSVVIICIKKKCNPQILGAGNPQGGELNARPVKILRRIWLWARMECFLIYSRLCIQKEYDNICAY